MLFPADCFDFILFGQNLNMSGESEKRSSSLLSATVRRCSEEQDKLFAPCFSNLFPWSVFLGACLGPGRLEYLKVATTGQ